jgi:signal transduction histidine kinase
MFVWNSDRPSRIEHPGKTRHIRLPNMKHKLIGLSQRYVTALRKHLKQGVHARMQPALRLGRQAVVLGLEPLDLARIHENALTMLKVTNGRSNLVKRAAVFFAEAITPIVETHRAAQQSKIDLKQLNEKLSRRTRELAATNRQLQTGVVRRKGMEAALKRSGTDHTRLLKESLQLQEGLRQLTHRVLAAQENEREKISRELQNEVAQTLLGINVRLLSLKKETKVSTKGFKNEIASTQRLVTRSARSMRRVTRQFGTA